MTSLLTFFWEESHERLRLAGIAALVFCYLLQRRAFKNVIFAQSTVCYAKRTMKETQRLVQADHLLALRTLEASLHNGAPVAVFLRSFDLNIRETRHELDSLSPELQQRIIPYFELMDSYRKSDAPRVVGFRMRERENFEQDTSEAALATHIADFMPSVGIRNLSWQKPGGPDVDLPRLSFEVEIWPIAVGRLIDAATLIIIHIASLTPGIELELRLILERKKEESTLIILCDDQRDPEDISPQDLLFTDALFPEQHKAKASDLPISRFPHVIKQSHIDYNDLTSTIDINFMPPSSIVMRLKLPGSGAQ